MKKLLCYVLLLGLFAVEAQARRRWVPRTGAAAPSTFVSASLNSHGDTLSVVVSGACTTTTGFTLATNGSAPFTVLTPTYSSGSGTTTLVFALQRNALATETVTVSGAGGADLTAFSTQAVTNSSTVAVKDSLTGTTDAAWNMGYLAGGFQGWSSPFTSSSGYTAVMVTIRLSQNGTAAGNLHAELHADSAGTVGSILTNGTSGDILSTSVAATETMTLFTGLAASISNATKYWPAVVHTGANGPDTSNDILVQYHLVVGGFQSYTTDTTTWSDVGLAGNIIVTVYGY